MAGNKVQHFDIAYSLGYNCAVALYMRSRMMRFASGPFDWVAGGTLETRINTITSGFEDFMRMSDLELRERDFGFGLTFAHDYYLNVHNGFRHYHDFKTAVPLEQTFPAVNEKYQRRIKRFTENLTNKRVLLIWYALEQSNSDELVQEYCNKIINQFGDNVHFLIIEHSDSDEITYKRLSSNIERYSSRLQVKDKNGHVTTMGDTKKMHKILSTYAVQNSRTLYAKKELKRSLIRFITLFIPIKKLRRDIRRKLYNNEELQWN